MTETPMRVLLLEEAAALTGGDRARDYGDTVETHQRIADIFNAITGRDLTARDAALVLVAVKLARLAGNPTHRDSAIDLMAYAGIAYECALAGNGRVNNPSPVFASRRGS